MIAEFVFLEYSFNPQRESTDHVEQQLTNLGFVNRANHHSHLVHIWIQHNCVLLVRQCDCDRDGITGVGLMVDQISTELSEFDNDISMEVTHDTSGTRIILCPGNDALASIFNHNYSVCNTAAARTAGLQRFSGMVFSSCSPRQMDFYQDRGFKFTKSGHTHNVLVSQNRSFSMLFDKQNTDRMVNTIIMDTDDIFATTSYCAANQVEFAKYATTDVDRFEHMAHKIAGYNVCATGNPAAYTFEKMAPQALPGVNILIRSRKQWIHTDEQLLHRHQDSVDNHTKM